MEHMGTVTYYLRDEMNAKLILLAKAKETSPSKLSTLVMEKYIEKNGIANQ